MRSLSADRHKCPSLEPNFFSPELVLAQYTVVNIYAVLIATPEAVLALIGSRILAAVYILYSGYATEWNVHTV